MTMRNRKSEVRRESYLMKLRQLQRTPGQLKILTGIRGCGKTVLVTQFIDELRTAGVPETNICYFACDDELDTRQPQEIFDEVKLLAGDSALCYVFLDEACGDAWGKVYSRMAEMPNLDVYLIRSDVYGLRLRMARYLRTPAVEVPVLQFSFAEFLTLHPATAEKDVAVRFDEYVHFGGMPIVNPDATIEEIEGRINSVADEVKVTDLVKQGREVDFGILKQVAYVLSCHLSEVISVEQLVKECQLHAKDVTDYLQILEEAHFIYIARRFDIRQNREMEGSTNKYYNVDTGFANVIRGTKLGRPTRQWYENIVYEELVRREYHLWAGFWKGIDAMMVGEKDGERLYLAIVDSFDSQEARDEETWMKEIGTGRQVILALDRPPAGADDGIERHALIDWLLEE